MISGGCALYANGAAPAGTNRYLFITPAPESPMLSGAVYAQ